MSLFASEIRQRIDAETQALQAAIARDEEDLAEALRRDLEDLRRFAQRHGC